jgi:hypothetical protein
MSLSLSARMHGGSCSRSPAGTGGAAVAAADATGTMMIFIEQDLITKGDKIAFNHV